MTGSGTSAVFLRLPRACAFAAYALLFTLGNGACSGAADSGLFGASGGLDDPSPVDAGSAVRDASSKPPSGHDGHDAQVDPGSPPDSAPPPPVDDASVVDASIPDVAPPDEAPGIRCGNATCDPATDVCCRIPGGASGVFACLAESACTAVSGALAIPCDDAVDCTASDPTKGTPGGGDEVCCVMLNAQSGKAEDISCLPAQSCTGTLQTNMCDPNGADPCPNGGTCKISQTTIPGYDICF